MAKKTYTNEEIMELLKANFNAFDVFQVPEDYNDEYRVVFGANQENEKHIEVVSTIVAVRNEADFSDDNDYWKDICEILLSDEELVQIGAYTKLADDLFWREF